MIQLRYFASLRESMGCDSEALPWQNNLKTIADLKTFLDQNHSQWQKLDNKTSVQTAVNQTIAHNHTTIKDGDEVAFFPPVTGG